MIINQMNSSRAGLSTMGLSLRLKIGWISPEDRTEGAISYDEYLF